jgi:hypothetical protein
MQVNYPSKPDDVPAIFGKKLKTWIGTHNPPTVIGG